MHLWEEAANCHHGSIRVYPDFGGAPQGVACKAFHHLAGPRGTDQETVQNSAMPQPRTRRSKQYDTNEQALEPPEHLFHAP